MNVCTRTHIYAIVQCILWLYYWSLQVSTCWQYHKKHYKVTLQNELKGQVFISWLDTGKCHPCPLIPDELHLQILEDSHCKTHELTLSIYTKVKTHMADISLTTALLKRSQGLPIGPAFHASIRWSWELWCLHVGGDWAVDTHVHTLLTFTTRPQATNTCATTNYSWGKVMFLRVVCMKYYKTHEQITK